MSEHLCGFDWLNNVFFPFFFLEGTTCSMYVCLNVYALMCTCVQAPVSTLGVCHYSSPLYYLRQNLSLDLEVANSARVADQCASGYSVCTPRAGVPAHIAMSGFYMGAGDSVLGPHA